MSTEVYDTPWDMAIDFAEEMNHDQYEIATLEHYQQKDNQTRYANVFPVLHVDDTDYGISLETSGQAANNPFSPINVRFQGELPEDYDIEKEINNIEKWKR